MTQVRRPSRVAGWLLSGACSLALIGGAAAITFVAERQTPVFFLDLASQPPAALSISVVAEVAPGVAATPPPTPEVQDIAEAGPVVPDTIPAPLLTSAAALTLPVLDSTAAADLSLPPPRLEPEQPEKPEPAKKPKARPEEKPETTRKKTEEKARSSESPTERAAPRKDTAPTAEASAPSSGSKAKGGGLSASAYAKAVLKKVRSTKRKSGVGTGMVVVGFSIAADGGLAGVQVLQSSGNAELDRIAVDHIQRSAPFPAPPPEAAGRGYSFEFVGK